jgi:nitrogen fixation/metabolism regulation signal transduction histidine kinase
MSAWYPQRPRTRRVAIMAVALLAVIVALFWPQAFSLHFQASPENTWLLFLLSTLSFLAAMVLILVLTRQVLKLLAERRANVLGARLKTKLVIGALALSLTPVICMFGFTYGLINRTLDKWFSQPVVTVRDDNQKTLDLLTRFVNDNAHNEAISIATSPALAAALAAHQSGGVQAALARHQVTLQGGFALVRDGSGRMLASFQVPPGYVPPPSFISDHPIQVAGQGYMLTHAVLPDGGRVEVAMPVPISLTSQIAQLAQDRNRYERLAGERRSLRIFYTGYLLLATLAVLFGATWLALHLSKMVTGPMGELAAATQEISRGNLAYRVHAPQPPGRDEIGNLVDSFNRMAQELEANRTQIEASRRELEARRRYTETLLENTPSAVISLDRAARIERVNPAVERLFARSAPPERLEDLFDAASLREVQHLLRKAERWPAAAGQLEVTTPGGGRALTLAATAAAIAAPAAAAGGARRRAVSGYVLVLEDLTDLLQIQKMAAWREVARRIAHEIKNPLTPIALSAQRIQRRLLGGSAAGAAPVIAECAATIEAEVRSLQRLVDEFSAFARFPRAQPVACDLNAIVEQSLRAFDGRLEGIEIRTQLEPDLPPLRLDPEDMKRVFINLIDNAAEALRDAPYRQITLATQQLDGVVEAVVADTGHGLPPGDRQRMFLPYYSTKQRGTGLGLAIAQRIVEDHGGGLRAEDNRPLGARFVVEIPVDG